MTGFALKGLLGRRAATALTASAIVLGVAMICGTLILTDSIDKAFDGIFTEGSTRAPTRSITGTDRLRLLSGGAGRRPGALPSTRRCSVGDAVQALDSVLDAIGGVGQRVGAP